MTDSNHLQLGSSGTHVHLVLIGYALLRRFRNYFAILYYGVAYDPEKQ